MLKRKSYPEFTLEGVVGFEDSVFSKTSSNGFFDSEEAIKFARRRGMVLVSAREFVVYNTNDTEGNIGAGSLNVTRTTGVCFRKDGKVYMAFDDDPSPGKNIIYLYVKKFKEDNNWNCILQRNNEHIIEMIKRADNSGRIVEDPFKYLSRGYIAIGTLFGGTPREKLCADPVVRAVLGDQTIAFAKAFCGRFEIGHCTFHKLEDRFVAKDGEVQVVGVNIQIPHSCMNDDKTLLYPDSSPFDSGYACGIRNPPQFRPYEMNLPALKG